MPHAIRGSIRRCAAAVAVALVSAGAAAGEAPAATSLSATVTPVGSAVAGAPQPVRVALGARLSGTTPPPVRRLALALPDGFTTALGTIASCGNPDFANNGSGACPAAARLGAGAASFVYASGGLRIPASTDELVLFHGPRADGRSTLHLYLKITKPTTFTFAIPGTIDDRPAPQGPLVTFDLSAVAQVQGGASVSVTRADVDVERGLAAAGACPPSGWAFLARLEYVSGALEEARTNARCDGAPDMTAPTLRVSARDGTPAVGARLAVVLSETASVRVTIERRRRGRWASVRRATLSAPAGASVLRIRRAGGRLLARGSYRARVRAVDAAGLVSRKRTVSFQLR